MRKVAIRGLLARRARLILTALAVGLGVTLMSGTFVFTDTFTRSFDRIFQVSYAGTDVVVSPNADIKTPEGEVAPLDAALLPRVQRVDGVARAEGTVFSQGVVYLDKHGKRIGTQAPSFVGSAHTGAQFGAFDYASGRAPAAPGEVALDKATAKRNGFEVGDTIDVQGATPKQAFKVVGIATLAGVDSFGGGTVGLMTLPEAQRVAGKEGRLDAIDVDAAPGVDQSALVARVRADLRGGVNVRTGQQEAEHQSADIRDNIGFIRTALFAFAGIALFVGAFGIFNTFSITVAQRARELALLRTLGASRGQVLRSVLTEGLVLGLIGSIIGAVAGVGVAAGLKAMFKVFGFDLPSSGTVVESRTIIVSVLVGTLVTLASTIAPALRATRIAPIEALREGIAPVRRGGSRAGLVVGLGLLSLGVALVCVGLFAVSGSTGALSLVGGGAAAVFLGVALLSPRLVGPLASVVGAPLRMAGITGRLARENTVRQPGRTAVTAAALMVGVALVTFASVFASSAKSTISGYIDTGLRSDAVIQNTDGFSGFTARANEVVKRTPGVRETGVIRFATAKLPGDAKKERSVTAVDPATFADVFRLTVVRGGSDAVRRLDDGSVLVSKKLADDRHVKVGDSLDVRSARGPLALRVIGVTDDKANLTGDLVVSTAVGEARFAVAKDNYVFVKFAPGADAAHVQRLLKQRLASAFPQVEPLTAKEFKQDQAAQINSLLTIVYALLALAVIVSLFGIVNTLVLSITERTRELGLLRAVGTTQRQTRAIVRFEAIVTALIGGVLGLGVGIVLAILVSQAVDDFALSIPVGGLIVLLVLAGIAGVLAAILPARRAARLDVLRALSYE